MFLRICFANPSSPQITTILVGHVTVEKDSLYSYGFTNTTTTIIIIITTTTTTNNNKHNNDTNNNLRQGGGSQESSKCGDPYELYV